ncbi:hypothetical protein AGABI1DRAFT_133537 [Agaricus bisporus var. burnettii JB137-S8]|uniref:Uncharacterized protein n=1 Tax=Agaricus bisporus var. burnettii (strain JB137-S8 / ATCC MYA-4627 / FGSC 10392) TaxID=597362 RepID=K5WG02_AGABU|nr:uncharacterized protein AGABI1DRAFT_133537 [Agaricus bisporus var. burnettii JB137-S8]EKM74181.1 hypothetical protein AGABI1DRAFT_133537 [Agaricus bisporus var. burnettii JB137-S8]
MPPKPKHPKAKSDVVVLAWADHVNLDELNENQRQFLFANSGSTPAILATLQHKGTITSWNAPCGDADGGDLFNLPGSGTQTTSTLGKRPQPPSPAPSTSLAAGTPPAKAGDDQDMRSPESPTPASAPFWGVYFRNLENALATLDPTHHQSARYLGTMLTGLQKIVHDERYLSLQVDGGFTVADLIDALPHRSSAAQPPHPPRVPETSSRPASKPPPKKVKFNPPSPLARRASAPALADSAPPPTLSKRPAPSQALAVSVHTPHAKAHVRRKQGKHTVHSPSRRGIIISPLRKVRLGAHKFKVEFINKLNKLLLTDLKVDDLLIEHAAEHGESTFLATTRVPTSAECAFVLKHVRAHFTIEGREDAGPITLATPTSTSYLKIVDIPITDPKSKDWYTPTKEVLSEALLASPVGASLSDVIKHVRIMRTSPHSDSCIAWIDISDTVSGTSAKKFIGKYISVARGAIIHPNAAVSACAALFAEVLIARILTLLCFKPPELPRHADESWPAYRRELELARDEENKRRKKKKLPPLTGPIFLHESIEFTRHWNVWEMDEEWGDIFRAIERGTKPVSQAVLKRGRRGLFFFHLVYERFCFLVYLSLRPRRLDTDS